MEIINLKEKKDFLTEYVILCSKEWGEIKTEEEYKKHAKEKVDNILSGNYDKLISVLGLVENNTLLGFISLFKTDGDEHQELVPWYATMYVKKEYRLKGYSSILHGAIIKEAKKLGYKKLYLKSNLKNYYEKFGAKYMETLNNGEKLYYIDLG